MAPTPAATDAREGDALALTVGPEPFVVGELRRIAAVVVAGALVGFVVAGWGTRLAMMLLAGLNPAVHGRVSDDGFVMGRFVLGDTLGLVAFGTVVGVVAGLVFLVVRGLRFGPQWFRTASMVVGPGVVVASLLVHADGIDFVVLQPLWLTVGLFVGLPLLGAWWLLRLGDRVLAPDSWFLRGSPWRAAPAALLLALLPLAAVVALGVTAHAGVRAVGPHSTAGAVTRSLARAGLVGVFGLSLWDLAADVVRLA